MGRVIVSTDDPEISEIASSLGAEVPFIRPHDLASNTAGTAPVIRHAIESLQLAPDLAVMCLYPTAALPSFFLEQGFEVAKLHPTLFTITVGRHRSPMERSLVALRNGLMELQSKNDLLSRTQDLPQRFFDAGKYYVANTEQWLQHVTMMDSAFVPVHLPDWASVDIDEPEDWSVAEALHKAFVLDSR